MDSSTTRIVWRRGPEVHHELGALVPGNEYDVRADVAALWIESGAAEAVITGAHAPSEE